jgi:putative hydrolase of the HAD superfamily
MALQHFKVLTLGGTIPWTERRYGMNGLGGTMEAERTTPDDHFRTLAELADAIDAGR